MPVEAEALQPTHRVEAAEALRPMQRVEPMHRLEPAEPLQPMHRAEAPQAMQRAELHQPMYRAEAPHAVQRAEPAELIQPMYRAEAPHAMQRVEAMPAQDATMTSGVSMTAATPFHQAVQPHEFSSAVEDTPAEPMQHAQASHVFQALEPTQAPYERVQSYAAFEAPVEEGYNPLLAPEAPHGAAAYETGGQAGGAPAQPLRPTVAHERPTRQPGQ